MIRDLTLILRCTTTELFSLSRTNWAKQAIVKEACANGTAFLRDDLGRVSGRSQMRERPLADALIRYTQKQLSGAELRNATERSRKVQSPLRCGTMNALVASVLEPSQALIVQAINQVLGGSRQS